MPEAVVVSASIGLDDEAVLERLDADLRGGHESISLLGSIQSEWMRAAGCRRGVNQARLAL